ncbi:MAG: chloride channel protein [Candidatus Alkanophagales archaeon]|nr:MAG: chloride channel protein [Candidatus Alkanophagales archaeon]
MPEGGGIMVTFAEIFKIFKEEEEYLSVWAIWTAYTIFLGIAVSLCVIVFYMTLVAFSALILGGVACYQPPMPEHEPHIFHLPEILHVDPLSFPGILLLALIPALGGLICGVVKFGWLRSEDAEVHETDAFIEGFHDKKGVLSGSSGLVRAISSVFTIGTGGSAGREGPSAFIGATVGSLVGRALGLNEKSRRRLVACGASAGIAAVFKSPLGGAFFGVEMLYKRDSELETLAPAVVSALTAYVVSCFFFGWGPIYGVPEYDVAAALRPISLLCFVLLGVICAPLVVLFPKIMELFTEIFRRLRLPLKLKPAAGGLLHGCFFLLVMTPFLLLHRREDAIVVASGLLGGGYGFIQLAFYGKVVFSVLIIIAFAKMVSTALTLGSGGSGGLFIPSLAIGAALGGAFGEALHLLMPQTITQPAVFALIGAAALLGGAANTPLTAIFVVCEISGSYALLAPAILATITVYTLTSKWTIYPKQYETRRDSPAHRREFCVDILEDLYVRDAYTRNVVTLPADVTIEEALNVVRSTGHIGYPVVRDGALVGMVTLKDLERVPEEERMRKMVEEVATKNLVVTHPEESLEDAMHKMATSGVGRLPVVDKDNRRKLIGILTMYDIVRAHERALHFRLE